MNIWSCKTLVAAVALTALAACDGGPAGSLLDGLTGGGDAPDGPLSQARMAFGAVTLVPPAGYCIDQSTLKQRFALMARCDKLGAPSSAEGAPVGILTASFASMPLTGILPTPVQTAEALSLEGVTDQVSAGNSVIFRAKGATPVDSVGAVHWRSTAQIGNQVVSLALFGPEGGRAVSSEGRGILSAVISGSSAGS